MKRHVIIGLCIIFQGIFSAAWSWPGGLRSSTSFFRGLYSPELKVASFGDSVASGFNSSFWFSKVNGGTYADHYGRWYNDSYDYSVRVRNIAQAGFTLDEILLKLFITNRDRIQEADLILLEGGGNDFLDLNAAKNIDLCKAENFRATLDKAKKNFLTMMHEVSHYKKASARVRVLGIYYPLVHETRARPCVLKSFSPSVHASFIKALSQFNWFLASESKKRGFTYVDTFAHLNCAQKDWKSCKPTSYTSVAAYEKKLFELDKFKILKDPGDLGWLQKDRVHPNTYGHNLISWAIRNP